MIYTYLSPHLDDAVLSCGGAIHRHAAGGDPVLVVTIFAGEAGADSELSSFALIQHGYWGNPPRPMRLRRAEDLAAAERLGAKVRHLAHVDAVYRTDSEGRPLYPDLEALFGAVHPDDPVAEAGAQQLTSEVADAIPAASPGHVVIGPLGLGSHVDHQIVCDAAWRLLERGYRVAFYEDFPYAERAGASGRMRQDPSRGEMHRETVRLDAADVAAKVSALRYYQTQLAVLFGIADHMPDRVQAFALSRAPEAGLAEILWWTDQVPRA